MGQYLDFFERKFKLSDRNTSFKTECIAGVTTFFTMAYIALVNPTILAKAGMDPSAVFLATCLVSGLGCVLVGWFVNYPIAIAPSMALNVYFATVIVQSVGYSWQQGLAIMFVSGVLFVVITLTRAKDWILDSIQHGFGLAIAAGIGLFLALIALQEGQIITVNTSVIASLADLKRPEPLLFSLCFFAIVVFEHYKVKGAIIFAILLTFCLSLIFQLSSFHGVMALPRMTDSSLFALDLKGIVSPAGAIIILSVVFILLFDSIGTLIGVLHQTELMQSANNTKRMTQILSYNGVATVFGSLVGTSSATPYVESAAGTDAGGRTGLTALVVASMFLLAIFFAPLALSIPAYITAAALLYIGCLMMKNVTAIRWDDIAEAAPAFVTILLIPFTHSIADGIAIGFLSFFVTNVCCRRWQEVDIARGVVSLLCLAYLYYHP